MWGLSSRNESPFSRSFFHVLGVKDQRIWFFRPTNFCQLRLIIPAILNLKATACLKVCNAGQISTLTCVCKRRCDRTDSLPGFKSHPQHDSPRAYPVSRRRQFECCAIIWVSRFWNRESHFLSSASEPPDSQARGSSEDAPITHSCLQQFVALVQKRLPDPTPVKLFALSQC